MLPVVTVKNATKQNILQISNGEIGDAKPGVAGNVGQRVLTLADFTYTYQGTDRVDGLWRGVAGGSRISY
ncbi:hypothetical protein WP50_22780 [Lactiplantibacillus plantarum]|nr:hypothetical protein WP50_22780 [Lactiplantibacillus plantarum]